MGNGDIDTIASTGEQGHAPLDNNEAPNASVSLVLDMGLVFLHRGENVRPVQATWAITKSGRTYSLDSTGKPLVLQGANQLGVSDIVISPDKANAPYNKLQLGGFASGADYDDPPGASVLTSAVNSLEFEDGTVLGREALSGIMIKNPIPQALVGEIGTLTVEGGFIFHKRPDGSKVSAKSVLCDGADQGFILEPPTSDRGKPNLRVTQLNSLHNQVTVDGFVYHGNKPNGSFHYGTQPIRSITFNDESVLYAADLRKMRVEQVESIGAAISQPSRPGGTQSATACHGKYRDPQ